MSYDGYRLDVGDTPTRVADANVAVEVLLRNDGSRAVDLGGADVTAGTGFALAVGGSICVPCRGRDDDLWAVTASGTTTLHVLVTRN